MRELRQQEDATTDLNLSALYRWQQLLGVPVSELLEDKDEPLSAPIKDRAQMLKLMKTIVTILKDTREKPTRRLAGMLRSQLLELMPELEEVEPWHGCGHSRPREEFGKAMYFRVPDELFGG